MAHILKMMSARKTRRPRRQQRTNRSNFTACPKMCRFSVPNEKRPIRTQSRWAPSSNTPSLKTRNDQKDTGKSKKITLVDSKVNYRRGIKIEFNLVKLNHFWWMKPMGRCFRFVCDEWPFGGSLASIPDTRDTLTAPFETQTDGRDARDAQDARDARNDSAGNGHMGSCHLGPHWNGWVWNLKGGFLGGWRQKPWWWSILIRLRTQISSGGLLPLRVGSRAQNFRRGPSDAIRRGNVGSFFRRNERNGAARPPVSRRPPKLGKNPVASRPLKRKPSKNWAKLTPIRQTRSTPGKKKTGHSTRVDVKRKANKNGRTPFQGESHQIQ